MRKLNVIFYSIVPSPYQRDLFQALSQCSEINLTVFYLEDSVQDSPWPQKPLQPYEQVLVGNHLTWGASRFHFNWHWPRLDQADVVVFNGYQNLIAQLILHTKARSIPCLFWGEKMVAAATGIKGRLQQAFAKGLNQCQAIVAIGSSAVADYQQRFTRKPVFNIPYYCDLSSFSQIVPQRPHDPVTLLFCGQMIQRKGVDLLLQAFEQLIQTGHSARLLLVGREAELAEMMQSLTPAVKQQIHYVGFQSPEDLPQFFQQADIFVLPSRYDGWGVVVNQALGAGLAIVCSDAVGAAHDLIEPGLNGAVFRSGNIDQLTQILLDYVQQPQMLQAASQASFAKAMAWSPEAGAQRWVEVLEIVANS